MEMIEASTNSAGATMSQHYKTTQSLEYAYTNLSNAIEKVAETTKVLQFIIRGTINAVTGLLNLIAEVPFLDIGVMALLLPVIVNIGTAIKTMFAAMGMKGYFKVWKDIAGFFGGLGSKLVAPQAALMGTAGASATAATSIKALGASLMAMAPQIAIVLAIVAALGSLVFAFTSVSRHTKALKKAEVALYDAREKDNSLNDKIDRYNELSAALVNTQEETEEIRSLQEELRGLGVSINAKGELDAAHAIAEANEEIAQAYEDRRKAAMKLVNDWQYGGDQAWGTAFSKGDADTKKYFKTRICLYFGWWKRCIRRYESRCSSAN